MTVRIPTSISRFHAAGEQAFRPRARIGLDLHRVAVVATRMRSGDLGDPVEWRAPRARAGERRGIRAATETDSRSPRFPPVAFNSPSRCRGGARRNGSGRRVRRCRPGRLHGSIQRGWNAVGGARRWTDRRPDSDWSESAWPAATRCGRWRNVSRRAEESMSASDRNARGNGRITPPHAEAGGAIESPRPMLAALEGPLRDPAGRRRPWQARRERLPYGARGGLTLGVLE